MVDVAIAETLTVSKSCQPFTDRLATSYLSRHAKE